jgi:hypothetical protein
VPAGVIRYGAGKDFITLQVEEGIVDIETKILSDH